MGTYVIGSGGDYTTFALAEAGISLPEVGGTTYQITGTLTAGHTFTGANYDNGLILTAKAGEETDGQGGGAFNDADIDTTLFSRLFTISNLRVRSLNTSSIRQAGSTADKCVFGENSTTDVLIHNSQTKLAYTDCIIADGSDDGAFGTQGAAGVTFDQCTFVDCANRNAMRVLCTDCLSIGSGSGDFSTLVTGSDYNASEDATATGTNSITGRSTADLEDYAGGNYNLATGSSLNTAGSGGGRIGAVIIAAGAAPTVTGPDTVTDGTSFTLTGTNLNSGTPTVALKETAIVASSKSQTIGTPTATTIPDVQGDTGQDELRDSAGYTPIAGIAIKAGILAAAGTAAVHEEAYDDGIDPEATHVIASGITVDAGLTSVQTMIAVATTTAGISFYASDLVVVEDNHQVVYPTTTNSVTLTADISGNGEFTYSHAALVSAGGEITFDALYYSPSTKNWSKVTVTLNETGIAPSVDSDRPGPLRDPLRSPLISPLITPITSGAASLIQSFLTSVGDFTFTRTGDQTYVDGDGVVQTVTTDNPAFTPEGILLEAAGTNLSTYSEDFSNGAWSKTNVTPSYDAVDAPDGTTTADQLLEIATTTAHRTNRSIPAALQSQAVYVKPIGGRHFQIMGGASGNDYANFDLTNGILGTLGTGVVSAKIEAVSNGFYRCSATFTTSSTWFLAIITSPTSAWGESYLGDIAKGIYIWGAQLETSSFPTSYIKTEGSTVTRNATSLTRLWDFPANGISFQVKPTVNFDYDDDKASDVSVMEFDDGTANNYLKVTFDQTNDQIHMVKRVSGGTPVSASTTATDLNYVTGDQLNIRGVADDTGIHLKVDSLAWIDIATGDATTDWSTLMTAIELNPAFVDMENINVYNEAKSQAFMDALT